MVKDLRVATLLGDHEEVFDLVSTRSAKKGGVLEAVVFFCGVHVVSVVGYWSFHNLSESVSWKPRQRTKTNRNNNECKRQSTRVETVNKSREEQEEEQEQELTRQICHSMSFDDLSFDDLPSEEPSAVVRTQELDVKEGTKP